MSHSDVDRVCKYIANQGEHHRKRTFEGEYQLFVKRYGLEWRDEGNRLKTVEWFLVSLGHPAEAGCESERHGHRFTQV